MKESRGFTGRARTCPAARSRREGKSGSDEPPWSGSPEPPPPEPGEDATRTRRAPTRRGAREWCRMRTKILLICCSFFVDSPTEAAFSLHTNEKAFPRTRENFTASPTARARSSLRGSRGSPLFSARIAFLTAIISASVASPASPLSCFSRPATNAAKRSRAVS